MATRRSQIAFRCPECGTATVGFLGGLTQVSDLLRLKCECGGSALDIKRQNDGKVNLSVPCVYCKTNHSFVVSQDVIKRYEPTKFSCPYSGMGITFIGDTETVKSEVENSANELSHILACFEAESLSDIQPQDVGEDSMPPDPAIYDTLNFIVRDLEAEGELHCPCGKGPYDLRFTDDGMQVYCDSCGATYEFHAKSVSVAEEYIPLKSITLK